MSCWWPLPGRVKHAQRSHQFANNVINQDVVSVRDKFAGTFESARTPKAGMVQQARGPLG